MSKPKVVIIGAGSYFFGRPAIWNMVQSPVLRNGTLALVDTDPDVLNTMKTVAERVVKGTGSSLKLEASTERKDVLKDADFVVLSFSYRNAHYRGLDTKISEKYGVRMCSSDTIGPGGIFRALREIPVALDVSRDMEKLCPDAWLINFVNPTTVIGIALMRHAPVRNFALCDGLHEPHHTVGRLKKVGILPEDAKSVPPEVEACLDIAIGGINHFTWLLKLKYKGQDMFPLLRKNLAESAANESPNDKAKPRFNQRYALQLLDIFGCLPIATSHTKEYVPYFQDCGVTPVEPEPIMTFNAETREREMAEDWKKNEQYASGEKSVEDFIENGKPDHATDIIESMWGRLGKCFYINSPNRGAVTNMADDAFLELKCHVDMAHGPVPVAKMEMPRGLLGLQQQVLDTHELTARAAVEYDRDILLRAMMTDPIVNNIGDAEKIMEELFEAEKEVLRREWYS